MVLDTTHTSRSYLVCVNHQHDLDAPVFYFHLMTTWVKD